MRPYQRVLSLDGGGTWALIEVRALRRMWKDLYGNDAPTGHDVLGKFDLAVSNSGGSIVLAALACDMPLEEISNLFESLDAREKIFRAIWPEALRRSWPVPRYPMRGKYDGLRESMPRELLELTLPAWGARFPELADLVIVGFDYDMERAAYFRSYPDSLVGCGAPTTATLLDATHASSNAPVLYFDEPTHMPYEPERRRYWDGAVGGYNNPTLAAAAEAIASGAARESVRILSLGTGTVQRPRRPRDQSETDARYMGGAPHGLVRDGRKLAGAILDDPPDAASLHAHVLLGGALPVAGSVVRDGPVVRLNPTIRPVLARGGAGTWAWPPGPLEAPDWERLTEIDMDAIAKDEVGLIVRLGEAWLDGVARNQPVRADADTLDAQIGHDRFAEGLAAVQAWMP